MKRCRATRTEEEKEKEKGKNSGRKNTCRRETTAEEKEVARITRALTYKNMPKEKKAELLANNI